MDLLCAHDVTSVDSLPRRCETRALRRETRRKKGSSSFCDDVGREIMAGSGELELHAFTVSIRSAHFRRLMNEPAAQSRRHGLRLFLRERPTKESHETCNQPSFRRAQPTGYDPDSYSAPSTGFPSNTISLVRFSGGMSILMVRR